MYKTKASYEILTQITDGALSELAHIERIARTCYKSEDRITEDGESARKMIKNLIARGHEAMLEHSSLTVKFIVDRGVSHEMVRHRLASFAQESTRYCNYLNNKFGGNITVIDITPGMELDNRDYTDSQKETIIEEWTRAMKDVEKHYMKMVEAGATPQIARSVLPNSLKTEIVITANYREWRTILKLRTENVAHPQMREVINPLLRELKERIPLIFDDID